MDFYPIIVQQGFRNSPDDHTAHEKLVQWLRTSGSPALVTFAWKIRHKLPAIIDDVWSWETVDDYLFMHGQSRIDLLMAAARSACGCGGDWYRTAGWTLEKNKINIQSLCRDVLKSLQDGRREDIPVLVLMGRLGGEANPFSTCLCRTYSDSRTCRQLLSQAPSHCLGLRRKGSFS